MRSILVFLSAALLATGVRAEEPPRTAPRAVVACQSCHEQTAGWLAKSSVHAPVKSGECLSCHNAHASRHGSLMRNEPAKVCLRCHEDLASRIHGAQAGTAHAALTSERGCLACHDPHASNRGKLLTAEPEKLCAGCHDPTFKDAETATKHAAFEGGSCLACHDPHGSTRPWLAVDADPALCGACHDTREPKVAAAHKGIAFSQAGCTSCHAPHASSRPGLIRPRAHAPFAEGSCDACHDSPKTSAAALRARAGELCAQCHEAWTSGHVVPAEGSCLSCHDPHASAGPALIAGRERIACLNCHADIKAQRAASVSHHPLTSLTADCSTCHDLHRGEAHALLKKKDPQQTCGVCHAGHAEFSHPMGEGVADPSHPGRSLSCLSCHDPHGTPYPQFLLADPRQDLCIRCHTQEGH